MGSLLRSEDMALLRLYFEHSAAFCTVEELGDTGVAMVCDLNDGVSPFQRAFASDVRRCDDMQRKLRFLEEQVATLDEATPLEVLREQGGAGARTQHADAAGYGLRLPALDEHLTELESALLQLNKHSSAMLGDRQELLEHRRVLEIGASIFRETRAVATPLSSVSSASARQAGEAHMRVAKLSADGGAELLNSLHADTSFRAGGRLLGFLAGIVSTSKRPTLERVLFRATRGNCFVEAVDITDEMFLDSMTQEMVHKSVLIIFITGATVVEKIKRICRAFDATRYPMPEDHEDQMRSYAQCRRQLEELEMVIATTEERRKEVLFDIQPRTQRWGRFVAREKAVLHAMNSLNFDTSRNLFIAEIWCPVKDLYIIEDCVERARVRANAQFPTLIERRTMGREAKHPPTYFRTNKFTQVFQSIIESYGVAEYHEINPAPFAVITFPFLFAVMFGDVGHGALMALFALLLILFERRLARSPRNEFLDFCYEGRYIIVMMGAFSIYTGFIYNEFFAVPLDIFGSRWKYTDASEMACGVDNCAVPAEVLPPLNPYPFGMDPIWKVSASALLFFNSYKMKLSIVLGVLHMLLGIFNSLRNARFFRVIFMSSLFGYLVLLIVIKWSINWNSEACRADPNCQPPDLKSILIDMFMKPGSVPTTDHLFPLQAALQVLLLLAAVVAVPWMFFAKPLLLKKQYERSKAYARRTALDYDNGEAAHNGFSDGANHHDIQDIDDEEPFNFQDVFVEQMIHTIEFVLGAVSNTASYLRLWALSLAHSELSDVFLEKLIFFTVSTGSVLAITVGFVMWLMMTLGVLMGMESLSAFLHALRLHWVEFQNKFYNQHGSGRPFVAFDLRALHFD